jgi:hypothetical protein
MSPTQPLVINVTVGPSFVRAVEAVVERLGERGDAESNQNLVDKIFLRGVMSYMTSLGIRFPPDGYSQEEPL